MPEGYTPKSDFLKAVASGEYPLSGSEFADANLRLLIASMRDGDLSNRDWATFLLALTDLDSPAIRDAFLIAAEDSQGIVRAEAAWGLARRAPDLALPFVQTALSAESIWQPALEAAALCAHPSLIEDLRVWAEPSDNKFLDATAKQALTACETGIPPEI